MKRKTVKRILSVILALVTVLGMGLTSYAETSDENYSRATLSAKEKATIKTIFDAQWYKEAYPDVVACVGESEDALFTHFLTHGMWETRQPSKDFNVNAYFAAYKDLQEAFGNLSEAELLKALYLHYALYGKAEGREYTTLEKVLTIVDEIMYIGSFHSEDYPKTQKGAVIASRKMSSSLLSPRARAIRINFLESVRAFAQDENHHFSNILTGKIATGSVFHFPGFEEYDVLAATTFEAQLEGIVELCEDLNALLDVAEDVVGYPNYASVASLDQSVTDEEAQELCDILLEYYTETIACFEATGINPDFVLTMETSDTEEYANTPFSDWNAYMLEMKELSDRRDADPDFPYVAAMRETSARYGDLFIMLQITIRLLEM